jgi:hypothetical protein
MSEKPFHSSKMHTLNVAVCSSMGKSNCILNIVELEIPLKESDDSKIGERTC